MFATTTAHRFPTIGGDSKGWEVPGNPAANRRALQLSLRATIKLGPQTTKPHELRFRCGFVSPQVCFGLPNPITLYRRDGVECTQTRDFFVVCLRTDVKKPAERAGFYLVACGGESCFVISAL